MSLDAMKQALEALELYQSKSSVQMFDVAAKGLRAAIEQAQANDFNPDWDAMAVIVAEQQRMAKRIAELEAQPDQQPVAWMYVNSDGECEQIEYIKDWPIPDDPSITPLYTAQRQWQGLTKDELLELWESNTEQPFPEWFVDFKRAYEVIEAKLKEKNT